MPKSLKQENMNREIGRKEIVRKSEVRSYGMLGALLHALKPREYRNGKRVVDKCSFMFNLTR